MPKLLSRKRSNLLYRHKYDPPIRGTKREKFPVSFSLSFLILTQNPAFFRALYTSDRIYRLLSALKKYDFPPRFEEIAEFIGGFSTFSPTISTKNSYKRKISSVVFKIFSDVFQNISDVFDCTLRHLPSSCFSEQNKATKEQYNDAIFAHQFCLSDS